MSRAFIVEADGGSRGNPGVAAGGAVLKDAAGKLLCEVGVYVGIATNNVAEYSGMIAGLRAAYERDEAATIAVHLDSKLVVEQMSGRWKIKHPDMQKLAAAAHELIGGRPVTFKWVPRHANAAADAVANESMDAKGSFCRNLDGFAGVETDHSPQATLF